MITKAKVKAMLEIIDDIVNEEDQPWLDKRDQIKALVKETKRYEVSFEEFISWFEGDEGF